VDAGFLFCLPESSPNWYARKAIEHGWSRTTLKGSLPTVAEIEAELDNARTK